MIVRVVMVIALALVVVSPLHAANIHKREKRQERRIERGERSGRLSPKEAARLENKEAGLKDEEQAMRNANGGKLSRADRRALQNQANKDSRAIARQKHDHNNN